MPAVNVPRSWSVSMGLSKCSILHHIEIYHVGVAFGPGTLVLVPQDSTLYSTLHTRHSFHHVCGLVIITNGLDMNRSNRFACVCAVSIYFNFKVFSFVENVHLGHFVCPLVQYWAKYEQLTHSLSLSLFAQFDHVCVCVESRCRLIQMVIYLLLSSVPFLSLCALLLPAAVVSSALSIEKYESLI